MALYGPKPAAGLGGARSLRGGGNTLPTYEIVVHSEKYRTQNLSVLRTSEEGKLCTHIKATFNKVSVKMHHTEKDLQKVQILYLAIILL